MDAVCEKIEELEQKQKEKEEVKKKFGRKMRAPRHIRFSDDGETTEVERSGPLLRISKCFIHHIFIITSTMYIDLIKYRNLYKNPVRYLIIKIEHFSYTITVCRKK